MQSTPSPTISPCQLPADNADGVMAVTPPAGCEVGTQHPIFARLADAKSRLDALGATLVEQAAYAAVVRAQFGIPDPKGTFLFMFSAPCGTIRRFCHVLPAGLTCWNDLFEASIKQGYRA